MEPNGSVRPEAQKLPVTSVRFKRTVISQGRFVGVDPVDARRHHACGIFEDRTRQELPT
jgi:hypothetical protein